jgi:AGZA family xanthine/uracil permease-like MFS transporter
MTALTVAALFLLALFLSPLAESVPIYATAPALIYVACLMSRAFTEFNWDDVTEYAPSVITAISMPLTFSIAEGIALGFVTYTMVKLISGRWRDLNATVVVLSSIFILKFALMGH